jgi:hypothetical protein
MIKYLKFSYKHKKNDLMSLNSCKSIIYICLINITKVKLRWSLVIKTRGNQMKILSIFLCFVTLQTLITRFFKIYSNNSVSDILKLFSHDIYKVWYQNVPFSYHYQMEINLWGSKSVFVIILTLCYMGDFQKNEDFVWHRGWNFKLDKLT